MNAQILESLAGVMPSHTLLANTFQTPIHKRRLCRALGCGIQEISKKLLGERGNPIHLVEKIIDLAFQIDCENKTTAHALTIAEHFFNYYMTKVREFVERVNCDWHTEANAVLREGTDVVITLHCLDVDERDLADLLIVDKEVSELMNKAFIIKERIRARIIEITTGGLETTTPVKVNGASNQLAPQSTTT